MHDRHEASLDVDPRIPAMKIVRLPREDILDDKCFPGLHDFAGAIRLRENITVQVFILQIRMCNSLDHSNSDLWYDFSSRTDTLPSESPLLNRSSLSCYLC